MSVLQALLQHATNETSQYICTGREQGRPPCREAPRRMTFGVGLESSSPTPWPSAYAVECPPRDRAPPRPFRAQMQLWTQAPSSGKRRLAQVGAQLWILEGQGSVPAASAVYPAELVVYLIVSYVTWYDMLDVLTWPDLKHDTQPMPNQLSHWNN